MFEKQRARFGHKGERTDNEDTHRRKESIRCRSGGTGGKSSKKEGRTLDQWDTGGGRGCCDRSAGTVIEPTIVKRKEDDSKSAGLPGERRGAPKEKGCNNRVALGQFLLEW